MQGVEFQGFAADCSIAGRITMFGDRLTDFLNGQERFHLHHLQFTSLEDGHVVAVDTGPRGSEKHRVRLEETRLQLSIGPYIILGRLHARPGIDPVASVLQREPMIPLTNATIAYSVAGATVAQDVGTIIVNRHQVEWIAAGADDASAFPGATIRSPYSLSLTKDFTGSAPT
jgi:hypothetical protein